MRILLGTAFISVAMIFVAGCGSNFEWLPEAGTGSSTTSSTTTATAVPVAKAGADQAVAVGATVTLDGSGSSSAGGAALSYSWSFGSRPTGSSAALSSATDVKPTFTADVAGAYVLSLTVNDGKTNSAAATVNITATAGNAAPVADAGSAQSVIAGTKVTLAGSVTDANAGDTIAYSWSLTSKPTGSSAVLSSATDVRPTFTPDVAGDYVVKLVVNDGKVDSAASTVIVTASVGNAVPVATAGADQTVGVNAAVTLDGSGSSDVNGDTLTYIWSIIVKPSGSSAALSSASVVNPVFTADVAGTYVVSLVVNDGKVNSAASTVNISAISTGAVLVTW